MSEAGDAGMPQKGGEGGLAAPEAAGAAGEKAGDNSGAGASGGGETNSGGGSGGTNTGGTGGSGGAGPMACNAVPHLGQPFTTTANKAGTAPVLTQGTIHPGLYLQTGQANYGTQAPDPQTGKGDTVRITVVNETATLQFDKLEGELPETMQIVLGQPATALPQSVEIVCAAADVMTPLNTPITSITYQASDTLFQLEAVGGGQGSLLTFTLQPAQ